ISRAAMRRAISVADSSLSPGLCRTETSLETEAIAELRSSVLLGIDVPLLDRTAWWPGQARSAMTIRLVLPRASRRGAGDLAEDGPGDEAGAARIVEIENAADQLAGRIEPADRLVVRVQHLGIGIDAQAAEREGDAAGHRVGLIGRLVDGVRPIALVDGEPVGAAAILDVGIERHVPAHGGIVLRDGLDELRGIDAVELSGQLLDRVGGHLGDLADAVFVALQVLHLLVEDLPGKLARLLENDTAVLRVGIVAEIGAFVDEALAGGVDHDGERTGLRLGLVASRAGRANGLVHLPADRMAA